MDSVISMIYFLAGLIVMGEAINKLYVVSPFGPNMKMKDRLMDGIKAVAWILLALAAGGALVGPFLGELTHGGPSASYRTSPSITEICGLIGFALIIVRLKIMEVGNAN